MKNKGISLIVLIVTVLVMMILATVVILLINSNGLTNKGNESIYKNDLATLKEQVNMLKSESMLGYQQTYSINVPDSLKKYVTITEKNQIVYIGDLQAPQAKWSRELGIKVIDGKERYQKELLQFIEDLKVARENGTQDFNSCRPDNLKDDVASTYDGYPIYVGDLNAQEADWSKELNVKLIGRENYANVQKLDELTTLAKTYVAEGKSTVTPNKLALQYIRRNKYTGGNWDTQAGKVDTNFVTYVNNNKTQNLDITSLVDPVTGKNIDFIHSMASLNVYVNEKTWFCEYSCWAGDICTLGVEVVKLPGFDTNDYEGMKEKIRALLGTEAKSSFSLEDMLADADAVNIYRSISGTDDLANTIADYYYYKAEEKVEKRYKQFHDYLLYINSREDDVIVEDMWHEDPIVNVCRAYAGCGSSLGEWLASMLIGDVYDDIHPHVWWAIADCFAEYIYERMN